ncbi:SGNH/GDSL hydrolase family protein [Flavobacterium sp. NRK F10]|uniref:SGNH/GDSL hydrolase family protein n=1 Tax=Flavobacterium sp. NRK F10 TaxID=2954931 RepID=UPI0020901FF3|nr:SGNH/GDSL hydrolase family protein [Flavobacterium sp. NRK F10]MCO6174110.1 SGNH/GDSL hydrolase family protein [Flavobacterium sp. NRK F10]
MKTNSYFGITLATLVLATISFLVFKEILPERIFPETKVATKNVVIDSLLLEAIAEEAKPIDSVKAKEVVAKPVIDPKAKQKITFVPIEGITFPAERYGDFKGNQYLIPFFEKLYQLQTQNSGNVRIAYYGDSMTDGDMIVQDLRALFQAKFGGQGVGFVNITSESAASRGSVKHQFSKNWQTQSYLKTKKPVFPFGVNGHVFEANDTLNNNWVKYKAGRNRFSTVLNNPTLFYGKSTNEEAEISVIVNETDTLTKHLKPDHLVNTLKLAGNTDVNTIKVTFKAADSIPVYGLNFDDGKGVHVDNFSSRGNSGLPLSMFDAALMQQFQKQLGYDLIVLHYGTNVLNYGSYNYSWYEKRMSRVVEYLRQCFPGVAILVISTADKATKYDLEMQSDSAVVPLVNAQKKYAVASKTGFVNLYELMGGDGSMVHWVEEEPSKANKDYTHFNYRGAREVAGMVYNQLDEGYEKYKKMRVKRKTKVAVKRKDSVTSQNDSIHAD